MTFSYYRERLIKNRAGMCWVGAVHEVVTAGWECPVLGFRRHPPQDPPLRPRPEPAYLPGPTGCWKQLEPRQQFYYGRELYYHHRWEEALDVFERFLEEGQGWVENNIDACCHCAYCHKELGHEQAALAALFRSFTYDRPRAEVCCGSETASSGRSGTSRLPTGTLWL